MTQAASIVAPEPDSSLPRRFTFTDLVSVSEVFARSINIKRDFKPEEDNKVSGFVPTAATEECLKAIADSIQPLSEDRARLIFGPYGGGKSNLGLVIARLMHSGCSYPAIQPMLDRIGGGPRPYFRTQIIERWDGLAATGSTKYLTVLLNGNEGPFRDAMLSALQQALTAEGLDQLIPRTAYRAARDRIRDWRENHEQAYKQLEALLARESETPAGLDQKLKDFSTEGYDQFCRLHPQLTAGSRFNPNDISRAHDVYLAVSRELHKHGYAGIFVIWDEFGSYFQEASAVVRAKGNSTELKELEQFAEACHGSRHDQLHFLALAHRSLNEYAELAQLDKQSLVEWKRISGRFDSRNLASGVRERDIYEVLARIFVRPDPNAWKAFLDTGGQDALDAASTDALRHSLFDWELDDAQRMIRQVYPLHPASAYILPRLSSAIAQNERTLFTYASYDEDGSMRDYLRTRGSFDPSAPEFVTVDALFDYFTPAMKLERPQSWEQFTLSLYEAGGESTPPLDRQVLQVMTIWDTVRENVRPLTLKRCAFALGLAPSDDVALADTVARLQQLGVIYERSDGTLLFAGHDRQTIQKDLQVALDRLEPTHDPARFLTNEAARLASAALLVEDIEPGPYLRKHKTRRSMKASVVSVSQPEHMQALVADLKTYPNQTEGRILYVVCESVAEIEQAQTLAKEKFTDDRIITVIPSVPLDIRRHTLRLQALLQLQGQSPYSQVGSGPAQMLGDHLNSARKQLEDQLRPLYRISSKGVRSEVWRKGAPILDVLEHEDLEGYTSELFASVYTRNLAIEDENLNTKPPSKASYTANRATRRNVMRQILRFGSLTKTQKKTLDFGATSQEFRYVRSLLQGSGFLSQSLAGWTLGRPKEAGASGAAVYDQIHHYLFSAEHEGKQRPVSLLVNTLSSPPYGLYSQAIAFLVAVAIGERAGQLQFFKSGKALADQPLQDTIDEMCYEPGPFTFINRSVTSEVRAFVNVLLQSLGRQRAGRESDAILRAFETLRHWGDGLTAYAKRTSRLSDNARILRDAALHDGVDPFRLIGVDLPKQLGLEDEIAGCGGDEAALTNARTVLKEAVGEVERSHLRIDDQVIEVACSVFGISSAPAETVLAGLQAKISDQLERADPVAREAVRPQLWDVQSWMATDHASPSEAFGELALRLVGKSDRSAWADGDLEVTRAKLVSFRDIVGALPGKPEPPSANHRIFLSMLAVALGTAAETTDTGEDQLAAVATTARTWYEKLPAYARETATLPEDARNFREAARTAEENPQMVLLHILPQRLKIEDDIRSLSETDAVNRIRLRLNRVIGVLVGTSLKPGEVIEEIVRTEFQLNAAKSEQVVVELRSLVEQRLAGLPEASIPQTVKRFAQILRADTASSETLTSIGELYIGQKRPTEWRDDDVAYARLQIREVSQGIARLKAAGPKRVRLMVSINGNQTSADLMTLDAATFQDFVVDLAGKIKDLLRNESLRDEGKALALANVLEGFLERQAKR